MRAARMLVVATALALATATVASATTINVPGDYPTIQAAVNAAAPSGDVIVVAAGTYVEQVVVNGKDLTIQGSGTSSTFVNAPAALATTFTTSGPNKPVITAENTGDVRITNLTVDGLGNGNANNRIVGIGYWNAGGKVLNCAITRIRNTPIDGVQAGNGILAANNTGGPYALEIGGTTVTDFQKNGMTLTGTGMTLNVHNCSVTGFGSANFIAQNGIQVSTGAGGTLSTCTISDLRYTPASVVSVGLLVFGPGALASSGLTINNCQVDAYIIESNSSINGIVVGGPFIAGQDFGPIVAANFQSSGPQEGTQASGGRARPEPFDAASMVTAKSSAGVLSSFSVAISNGCLNGADVAGTWGVEAYSAGGALSVTVTNTNLSNWEKALVAEGAATTLTANNNSIFSNFLSGYDNASSGSAQNAENNWWGSADGPSGAGTGAGDAVVGPNVDFTPWLVNGSATNPSCTPQPAASNTVTPGPAPSCISQANPCITIPVKITRTDAIGIRGYSVTFQLSANLQLCNGPGDITSGSYLLAPRDFHVISNGGGSYTVDEATLGLPCGATGNGTLFNIPIKSSGPDGTGTITITGVILRDCNNAPVAGTAGPPLNVTIDQNAPAAIVLSALQKKIGNSATPAGTTDIQLSWTGQEAGSSVAVYRKGFGGYPDYDEAGGFVPPAPLTPAAAVIAGWTLTSVTTSGGFDRVAARDFYYFIAWVTDPCGNVSVASNRTNGTLNYHLGDTHNGVTNCAGNNLVNTSDISHLGANYGATGIPVAGANECIDVGPTTDFSVNARPTTDHKIQFEDLIMYAINYGQVSAPQMKAMPAAAASNALRLTVPSLPASGQTFAVGLELSGTGALQGLTTELSYDRAVVEFLGVESGALLARQAVEGVTLSSHPGNVDVALLGVGAGLRGEGEVARALFRVRGSGEAKIAIASVEGRDAQNLAISLGQPVVTAAVPKASGLSRAMPTPFRDQTTIEYALAQPGRADLAIYTVQGRRIRSLASGEQAAGLYRIAWDGRDDGGRLAPAGVYFARLATQHDRFSTTLIRVR